MTSFRVCRPEHDGFAMRRQYTKKKIVFGNGLLDGLISNDSFRAVHSGHSQDGAQRKKPVAIFIERKSEFDT